MWKVQLARVIDNLTYKLRIFYHLLCVTFYACVNVQNVIADEPDQVGEVGYGGLVYDEAEHGVVFNLVDVEGERAHGYPHHALRVVEELDGLGVQGEVIGVLKKRQSSMSKSANLA